MVAILSPINQSQTRQEAEEVLLQFRGAPPTSRLLATGLGIGPGLGLGLALGLGQGQAQGECVRWAIIEQVRP